MDTLFVHRSVLARTYKFSIIPIEHPLMTLVFCWSWLMVMLQVRIYVCLVLRLVSAALDLAPYWVTNASWSLSSLTRIDDDYSGGIDLATCYKYEWSIYSRQKLLLQRSCIDGLNLGLKLNKISHTFLSFMTQKPFNMIWEIVMTVALRAAVQ